VTTLTVLIGPAAAADPIKIGAGHIETRHTIFSANWQIR